MKEQRVVPRRVVRRPDEKAARACFYKHIDCLALGAVWVEPREHRVRVDCGVQVFYELSEDHALFTRPEGRKSGQQFVKGFVSRYSVK